MGSEQKFRLELLDREANGLRGVRKTPVAQSVVACLVQQPPATRSRRQLRAQLLWPPNARCNGAPLSETNMKDDLGLALSVSRRAQFIPEQSENYTVSPSAAN